MRIRRRIAALLALFGVAWATLWPLVSAAHAQAAGEAMPLCHQAGMMVMADDTPQAPEAPGAPAPKHGGTHCPLCIMAFYVAFQAPIEAPPFTYSTGFVSLDTYCSPLPFGIEVALPESRAPPRSPRV
jgi:hypothetical protein